MAYLFLILFGFCGVLWMLFSGTSGTGTNACKSREYSVHDDCDAEELESLSDFDSIERAYSSGKIDNFDLQQLYDDCTIDEEEAELLGGDSLDLDDDFDDSY